MMRRILIGLGIFIFFLIIYFFHWRIVHEFPDGFMTFIYAISSIVIVPFLAWWEKVTRQE